MPLCSPCGCVDRLRFRPESCNILERVSATLGLDGGSLSRILSGVQLAQFYSPSHSLCGLFATFNRACPSCLGQGIAFGVAGAQLTARLEPIPMQFPATAVYPVIIEKLRPPLSGVFASLFAQPLNLGSFLPGYGVCLTRIVLLLGFRLPQIMAGSTLLMISRARSAPRVPVGPPQQHHDVHHLQQAQKDAQTPKAPRTAINLEALNARHIGPLFVQVYVHALWGDATRHHVKFSIFR